MTIAEQLNRLRAHMLEEENDEWRPISSHLRYELESIMGSLGISYTDEEDTDE